MTPDERRRLREVQRRLRETHQRLFDLQGNAIAGLREAVDSLGRAHDEMTFLFRSDDDLEDLADDEGSA